MHVVPVRLGDLQAEKEDEEELAFLLNLVRTQGLEDNLPCPSPSQEQMAVWRRARGAQRLTSADAETPRPVGGARRLNRFSVDTPISVASPSDTPSSAGAQEAHGVLSEEKSVKRLRTSLEKLVSTETKEVKADAAVTETPSKEAPSKSVEPKVKSKPKTPQKETWKVAKIEFKKEEKSTWKCNQARCRFKGAETAEKMRRHLKFHKLTDCEIEMLAGDEDTDTLYSCSMDGEIKSWSVTNPAQPHALATVTQTVTSIIRGEMSKLPHSSVCNLPPHHHYVRSYGISTCKREDHTVRSPVGALKHLLFLFNALMNSTP